MHDLPVPPEEVLWSILAYLYPPWHLIIQSRENQMINKYYQQPKYFTSTPLPVAPLLTSKKFHRLANRLRIDAFTGDINAYDDPAIGRLPPSLTFLELHVRRLCIPLKLPPITSSLNFIKQLPNIQIVEVFIDDPLTCKYSPFQPDPELPIEACRQRHIDWVNSATIPPIEIENPSRYGWGIFKEDFEIYKRKGLTLLQHQLGSFHLHPDLIYDVTHMLNISDNPSWTVVKTRWRTGPFGAEYRI